ncbi:hypothetical protein RB195_010793 [Necator americanus]|uniref:Uncharacterized protein n=1 Tax=Necator americanus TaxID=51031 RepID=A0ABR1D0A5_NECAM
MIKYDRQRIRQTERTIRYLGISPVSKNYGERVLKKETPTLHAHFSNGNRPPKFVALTYQTGRGSTATINQNDGGNLIHDGAAEDEDLIDTVVFCLGTELSNARGEASSLLTTHEKNPIHWATPEQGSVGQPRRYLGPRATSDERLCTGIAKRTRQALPPSRPSI